MHGYWESPVLDPWSRLGFFTESIFYVPSELVDVSSTLHYNIKCTVANNRPDAATPQPIVTQT